MGNRNMTEFIPVGLTQNPKMQKIISVVFFCHLHHHCCRKCAHQGSHHSQSITEFFHVLFSWPFIDTCYSSVNIPKLITYLLHGKKTILFNGCMTQIFGEHFFGGTEVILLMG